FDEEASDQRVAAHEVVLGGLAEAEEGPQTLDLRRAGGVSPLVAAESIPALNRLTRGLTPPARRGEVELFGPARLRQFHLLWAAVPEPLQERRPTQPPGGEVAQRRRQ